MGKVLSLQNLAMIGAEALETALNCVSEEKDTPPVSAITPFQWPQALEDGGVILSLGNRQVWIHISESEKGERIFGEAGDSWVKARKVTKKAPKKKKAAKKQKEEASYI